MESMAIRRIQGDSRGIATCQLNLGYVEQHDGNLRRALEYYRGKPDPVPYLGLGRSV